MMNHDVAYSQKIIYGKSHHNYLVIRMCTNIAIYDGAYSALTKYIQILKNEDAID